MTTTQVLAFGLLVVWMASALTLGLVMHRRGYSGTRSTPPAPVSPAA